ncbi:ABC transporter substrate-binding protein [[Eubacterium] cellulosolvens]
MSTLISNIYGKAKLLLLVTLIILISYLGYQYLPQPTPSSKVVRATIALAAASTGSWPIFIAEDSGIFDKYALDVTIVDLGGGRNVVAGLTSGQVQIGSVSIDSVISARLQGIDVIGIGAAEKQRTFYLVTSPEITSVEQLRGKIGAVITIGTGMGYLATAAMLRQFGLDPTNDVTLVEMSINPMVRLSALEAGTIDFTLTTEALNAKKLGLNVLFYLPDVVDNLPGNGYAVTTEYLIENRETVKRFLKSVTEATEFFFENKEESKAILSKWIEDEDPQALEQLYQDWVKVALKIPTNNPDQVRTVLEVMTPYTAEAANTDPEIFIDNSIVEELENEGYFNNILDSFNALSVRSSEDGFDKSYVVGF